MQETKDILEVNKLISKLEGLEDEQKIGILVDFIKQHEKKIGDLLRGTELIECYADISKYTQFLKGYQYKFRLLESIADNETLNRFKEECPKDKIDIIYKIIEGHSNGEKLELIKDFIRKYEKGESIRAYYDRGGTTSYTKYTNIDKYVELLDNYDDKFTLAQEMCDFVLAEKILEEYPFTEDEKKRYEKLAENNEDIVTVIKPKILSEKYEFLSEKLDFIVNDPGVSSIILELSDKELSLFKLLYTKAEKENAEILHTLLYMPIILRKMSRLNSSIYDNLQMNEQIPNDIIEKLLWIYTLDYNEHFSIKKDIIEKLNNLDNVANLEKIIKETCDSIIDEENKKDEKDIDKIKDALIMSSYGISLKKVEKLLDAYNISKMELNEENKSTMLMYLALSQICNENNPNKLIAIYNEYTLNNPIKIEYLRDVVFQNELRRMFAKELNSVYANVEEFQQIDEQEGIQIYDAGTDFKICMTAIGAYQENFKSQENYFDYWNNKKIISHINCCSLIANNNLTSAKITNICLGFSGFDEDMLICGSNGDMNSTDESERMYGMEYHSSNLRIPEELIDATRGQYNEIDYERRDLGNGQHYKKNPDFIVFFEEFDDFNNIDINNEEIQQILSDEKRKWQESVKAAKEFGIPIVKINRERCAKAESEKIEDSLQKYLETHDISLLSSIITNFENNKTGTRGHNYLTEKYFSNEKIQDILEQIIVSVNDLQDEKLKISNKKEIIKLLKREKDNTIDCGRGTVTNANQLLGFDVDEYLERLTKSLDINLEDGER